MGGARQASSRLMPFFRNAAATRHHHTSAAAARNGGFASTRQIGRSCAGSCDENRSSQEVNSQQKHSLRAPFSTVRTSNGVQDTRNFECQRWRSIPGMRERQRFFNADAQSDPERKGLLENQIGEELLSEAPNQASSGGAGLKLADGETLSSEEEAILKDAEAEFESAQQTKEEAVSVESIQEMLKELQAVAGPKDPRIAIISLRLGQEYEAQREDPKTFLKLGEQALGIFQTAGEFSLEIGMCHHLIALAHHRQGQQERSLENLEKALALLQGKQGKESAPVKFAVQFLLGDTLSSLGKHEEALQHYVEGLAVQETILEEGHPQLANNYRQVAEAFTQVMLFDEAKALVERALEAHIKSNGKGSMDEAIDRRLLSVICSGLEEYERALEEQQAVRSILKEKHLDSEALFVEIAIADTQVTLGRFDDAIATLQNATSQLDEGNSMRALATVNLAKAYMQQGSTDKAQEQSSAAIALLESKLEGATGGDTELLTAGECYTELAAIHQQMNQPDEAIALLQKGLAIYQQLPQQLNATAGSQAQIGMLLLFNGKANEALPFMEEAAANLRQSFGAGHFSLALVLNHLAVAHVEVKNMSKAVELFEEAKSIYTKTHGPGQQDTLAIFYNLMKVYASMGRKEEAIANAKHIVTELEKQGEPAMSALAEAEKDLATLEEESQSISSPQGTQ